MPECSARNQLTLQGPVDDASDYAMDSPVTKKTKNSKSGKNAPRKSSDAEDEGKEEEVDPSKLDIRFVDQT